MNFLSFIFFSLLSCYQHFRLARMGHIRRGFILFSLLTLEGLTFIYVYAIKVHRDLFFQEGEEWSRRKGR